MEKQVYFSIVMPVYGVEAHLAKAIDSVLAQTEKDFEIVLVDDASPDNCPKICEDYASRFENICVIHHEKNKGLSEARNTGLQHINGKYVTFMDSDDYIDNNLLERVKASLEENSADCVVFGIREEYYDARGELKKTYDLLYGQEKRFSSAESLRPIVINLEEKTFYGYAWNKFYKTEIIKNNNLLFKKVTLIEDIEFNVHFFDHIDSLNILNFAPYHYMKRIDGSLTNKFVKDYYILHKSRVSMILEQHRNWGILSSEVKKSLANSYARYIFSALQRNCDPRSEMNKKDRRDFLNSVFEDALFIELSPYISAGSYAGVLYGALKKKRTSVCLAFGRAIYIVKEKLPIVFAAAKQRKV